MLARRLLLLPLLLLLAQQAAAGETEFSLRKPVGNVRFAAHWEPTHGLGLRLVGGDGAWLKIALPAGSVVAHGGLDDQQTARLVAARWRVSALPPAAMVDAQFVLKLRHDTWTLYCQDKLVVRLPRLFAPTTIAVALKADVAAAGFRFQKTGPITYRADFMVPDKEARPLADWQTLHGVWRIHSAHEDAVALKTSNRLAKQPLEAGRSPNLHSLKAHRGEDGRPALITAGYTFYDNYAAQAAIRVREEAAGIVVCHRASGFYLFTLAVTEPGASRARLELRRCGSQGEQTVLRAAEIMLAVDQWVLPRVEVSDHRIRCLLDNIEIFAISQPMPPGGQFGLYTEAAEFQRFDDMAVTSLPPIQLNTAADVRLHTVADHAAGSALDAETPTTLTLPAQAAAQFRAFGSLAHGPTVFAAAFTPSTPRHTIGLITGFTGTDRPYLRFTCERQRRHELFRLERVHGRRSKKVESWRRRLREDDPTRPVRLLIDGTEDGLVRCYRDGDLVIVHQPAEPPAGAAGIYLGRKSGAAVSRLEHRLSRYHPYRNRHEKNRIFARDPYMRHWSSPEGNWIHDRDGLLWYKSDFLGRFSISMPSVDRTEIHLAVPDGETVGTAYTRVRNGKLQLFSPDRPRRALKVATLPHEPAPYVEPTVEERPKARQKTPTPEPQKLPSYTLHCEGYWLWATSEGQVLFKERLLKPFQHVRARITGFTNAQLGQSRVERFGVRDYLFHEAPTDWVLNGGDWQIINRFQCQPRWSHMNGQNTDGPAAIWTKYTYGGDFCVEIYAGMRHGTAWYNRCGDVNITMMNQRNTPSLGYTVTCTGWDFDESQRWTRFYRNGEQLQQDAAYTMPRWREGNVRKWQNPLLAAGRPVHGAWYYIKMRRRGTRLEYYFDNELILSHDEDGPLPDGQFGLWTFMNSIMIARVKIAADSIRPRQFEVTQVAVEPPPPPAAGGHGESPFAPDSALTTIAHAPGKWQANDAGSRCRVTWHESSQGRYFVATNMLGGGAFSVDAQMQPVPVADIAGFRFYVKRTTDAQFNFHYSIGTLAEDGTFTVVRRYFHELAGTDFSRGPTQREGGTPVAAATSTGPDWHTAGDFARVDAFLPIHLPPAQPAADDVTAETATAETAIAETVAAEKPGPPPPLYVRIDGFGNRQPSFVLAGLHGNGTGEAYAVAGFAPILAAPPVVKAAAADVTFTVADRSLESAPALNAWLVAQPEGMHSVTLAAGTPAHQRELLWLSTRQTPQWRCEWVPGLDAVDITPAHSHPDRRLAQAQILLNDQPPRAIEQRPNGWRAFLPAAVTASKPLRINVIAPWPAAAFELSWSDRSTPAPPQLISLQGATPCLMNFNSHRLPADLAPGESTVTISSARGGCLAIANTARHQRLKVTLPVPDLSLARYPLMQFAYRADEMAAVSMQFGTGDVVFLGEKHPGTTVRHSSPLVRNERWHTWTGAASDALATYPYRAGHYRPETLTIGSLASRDQTGKYSRLWIDDLVFGPAVREAAQLRCTPQFHAPAGVIAVESALISGATAWHSRTAAEQQRIRWQRHDVGAAVAPSLAQQADGEHHLLLRAVDQQGRHSPVTDIPFLLDRQAPTISHEFSRYLAAAGNGAELQIHAAADGGAPLQLSKVTFAVDGAPVSVNSFLSRTQHTVDADMIGLNWPYLFRARLDTMADGDSFDLTVAGLVDGAGNSAPDVVIPIQLDLSSDRTGPALLPARYDDDAVLWNTAWEGRVSPTAYFTAASRNPLTVEHQFGRVPYLSTASYGAHGAITVAVSGWYPHAHPHLSFRARVGAELTKKTRITVRLHASDGKHYDVLVGARPKRAAPVPGLVNEPDWRVDIWDNVTIDALPAIRRVLKDDDALAKLSVHKIQILRSATPAAMPFHVQSVFVHAPWRAKQTVRLDAYDASGVVGVDWQFINGAGDVLKEGSSSERTLTPAALALPQAPGGWLLLRARDRAGNQSVPLRVPCPIAAPTP
jgi:hypothetical protein